MSGEEYGEEELDPEWAALLADINARLQVGSCAMSLLFCCCWSTLCLSWAALLVDLETRLQVVTAVRQREPLWVLPAVPVCCLFCGWLTVWL